MSNELDKHIGETLGRYESSLDAEALWLAVKPPKKRKPWLWLLLLAGVIAIAGGLWSWSVNSEHDRVVEDYPSMVDHSVRAEEKETLLSSPKKEEASVAAQGVLPTSSTSPAAESISLAAENKSELALTGPETKAAGEKQILTQTYSGIEKASIVHKELEAVVPEQASVSSIGKTAINFSDQEKEPARDLLPSESVLIATKNRNDRLLTATTAIETLAFEAKSTGEEQELLLAEPSVTPYRRSKQSPFFAQIDVAYFGLQRELENKDSLAWDWASDRTNSEKLLEGVSADLSFGYRSQRGWQVRGGLGYTQINTLFGNTVSTLTVDSVEGLQVLIYNPDNSVDSIFGLVAFYETTSRLKQTYNSIRQWELPILGGYNFELGRLTLLAEAGMRLQLSRSWEGTVFNRDLESNFQDLSTTDWYRTGLGLSLQGGLQLAYPITSQIDILAGGSVRYSLQDFSSDASPFMERYQLLGGQLGLRCRF